MRAKYEKITRKVTAQIQRMYEAIILYRTGARQDQEGEIDRAIASKRLSSKRQKLPLKMALNAILFVTFYKTLYTFQSVIKTITIMIGI
jgi:hypothetical protein